MPSFPNSKATAAHLATAATLSAVSALLGSGNSAIVQPQVNEMDKLPSQWLSDLETSKLFTCEAQNDGIGVRE